MIFQETETIGHLRAAGYAVVARCSRCDSNTLLNLEALEAEKGPLFTFWNKHPPCPQGLRRRGDVSGQDGGQGQGWPSVAYPHDQGRS